MSPAELRTSRQRPLQFALGLLLAAKYFGAYGMDPRMGIVGALRETRWSWDLLTATACVLLDRQAPDAGCAKIRKAIEADSDTRITDFTRMVGRARHTCSDHCGRGA